MTREERLAKEGIRGEPVLFYSSRDQNGIGSNFSRHGMVLSHPYLPTTAWYATGEHRYQAMKAIDADAHEKIRMATGPGEAKRFGGQTILRPGWGSSYGDLCYYVMLEVILAKVQQNREAAVWLAKTEDRFIAENSPTDDIWGWRFGGDYRGRNLLGRCWMDVREFLQISR